MHMREGSSCAWMGGAHYANPREGRTYLLLLHQKGGEGPIRVFREGTQRPCSAPREHTNDGTLYEVACESSPTGRPGPLANSLEGLGAAWTWDHLARQSGEKETALVSRRGEKDIVKSTLCKTLVRDVSLHKSQESGREALARRPGRGGGAISFAGGTNHGRMLDHSSCREEPRRRRRGKKAELCAQGRTALLLPEPAAEKGETNLLLRGNAQGKRGQPPNDLRKEPNCALASRATGGASRGAVSATPAGKGGRIV